AAYNFGIGNIVKKIDNQGKDYFSMNLNPETAVYVYKIIAVKELFEYPELYMKNFGYNVFSPNLPPPVTVPLEESTSDAGEFQTMEVKVSEEEASGEKATAPVNRPSKYRIVLAKIRGKYKSFSDGTFISIELQDNLQVKGRFNRKGTVIHGTGWLIDNKIFIDLGFNNHEVILYDADSNYDSKGYCQQGINEGSLKNNHDILLKVQDSEDE
ncbi:MAG TPA: hypothetical protein VF540_01960, partial [Segetibacter sp.]